MASQDAKAAKRLNEKRDKKPELGLRVSDSPKPACARNV